MIAVAIKGIGLAAPGLPSWAEGQKVLRGELPYEDGDREDGNWPSYRAPILAPNERRRTTATIRLTLQVAQEAVGNINPTESPLPSVFATRHGDLEITTRICEALTAPQPQLSPTQFHNSVRNAPAGYWAIATRSLATSVTIAAFESTFCAGLLEAAVQTQAEGGPVLLVAYDHPGPTSLRRTIALNAPFAVALVLHPLHENDRNPPHPRFRLGLTHDPCGPPNLMPELEALRAANPIAQSLPLLQALARGADGRKVLPYLDALNLGVDVAASPEMDDVQPQRAIGKALCQSHQT